ncbi:DUF1073 domain-containing protein [Candidatus Kirkpatrickella diaphorinae]|uniref:DUF1073 domain-containing protein n=1 Tax=Candidatus Kirkpatrickella diaphorinae TaxID=2984322 RepID=A0ABY6GHP4_9PROT|nr:DUF1073 domain-containing protein [Candidatus Kirkpatrickella diaphorinae]UYH50832.1 DUF1073 domain-containing protein [Candidatus Kirkpatrickella diaphorinae]
MKRMSDLTRRRKARFFTRRSRAMVERAEPILRSSIGAGATMSASLTRPSAGENPSRRRFRYDRPARHPALAQQALEGRLAPYEPPQGVRGPGFDRVAMDASLTALRHWVDTNPSLVENYIADGLGFPGYAHLAEMAQRAEFRKPCEVIARECTRAWLRFVYRGHGHDDAATRERLDQIEQSCRKLALRDVVKRQVLQALTYGIGHIWVGLKNQSLDTAAQSAPLRATPQGMGRATLERLVAIEPVWTTPNSYDVDNPLSPDHYRPRNWWVQGRLVDRSRLLTMVPYEVSDILKPAFNFGGLSLTQQLKSYVHNFLRTRNAVAGITANFSRLVLLTDMAGNMQAPMTGPDPYPGMSFADIDASSIHGRAALMQDVAEGQSTIIADKNAEDAKILSTPLNGLDKLLAQSMEAMASIPGIPLVKLFGLQPSGLNASSDGEIRVFYDEISAFQEALIRPIVQRVLDLVQLDLWGEIDPKIDFIFNPLWQMDEKTRAETERSRAETVSALVKGGIVSGDEARRRLAAGPVAPYA